MAKVPTHVNAATLPNIDMNVVFAQHIKLDGVTYTVTEAREDGTIFGIEGIYTEEQVIQMCNGFFRPGGKIAFVRK